MTSPQRPLTPTQTAVYEILLARPHDGACRRTFSTFDLFEVANRIAEIEDRLGITIQRDRCTLHAHRRRFTRYRI